MSQLAQEKQVNLGTSARLNALSQYVLQISFTVEVSVDGCLSSIITNYSLTSDE